MKNYRIYAEIDHRIELVEGNVKNEDVILILDQLILVEKIPVIIVIEHDFENDIDFPIYLYHNNQDEYLEARNSILGGYENEQCKDCTL